MSEVKALWYKEWDLFPHLRPHLGDTSIFIEEQKLHVEVVLLSHKDFSSLLGEDTAAWCQVLPSGDGVQIILSRKYLSLENLSHECGHLAYELMTKICRGKGYQWKEKEEIRAYLLGKAVGIISAALARAGYKLSYRTKW